MYHGLVDEMRLIDSHCHLDFAVFTNDRATVIAQARAVGVQRIIVPAVTQCSWAGVAQLCEDYPCCAPAYGLHPYFAHQATDVNALADWLSTHPAVAIGEAGLDFAIDIERTQQQHYFIAQLELAQARGLPIILHAHRALEQVLQTLKAYPDVRFVVHAFSGSDQQLARLLDLGGYIGVGGSVTYPRAQRLRRQITTINLERILLETDAPHQPLCGRQGQRNEPAYVAEVAQAVAELRGLTTQAVAAHSYANAVRLFSLSPDCTE